MKRMKIIVMSVVCLAAFAAAAAAGTPGVDQRQQNQRARIAQGVVSGELTRGEAMRLRAGQRQIVRQERRAKADGIVTARERARLHASLNRENRTIYRLKHNHRSR